MFVDFLCTDVSSLLPHLVMFMPTKEIVSCSAVSIEKFKFSWQGVQFIKESVGFVEVWHDIESIIHVPFIKRGELVSLFQFFFYGTHEGAG